MVRRTHVERELLERELVVGLRVAKEAEDAVEARADRVVSLRRLEYRPVRLPQVLLRLREAPEACERRPFDGGCCVWVEYTVHYEYIVIARLEYPGSGDLMGGANAEVEANGRLMNGTVHTRKQCSSMNENGGVCTIVKRSRILK